MNMSMRQTPGMNTMPQNVLSAAAVPSQPGANLINPQGPAQNFFSPSGAANIPPAMAGLVNGHVQQGRTANPALYGAQQPMSDEERNRRLLMSRQGIPQGAGGIPAGAHMTSLGGIAGAPMPPGSVQFPGPNMMPNQAALRRVSSTPQLGGAVGVGNPGPIDFHTGMGLAPGGIPGAANMQPQNRVGPQHQPPVNIRTQAAAPQGPIPPQMYAGQPMHLSRSGSIPGAMTPRTPGAQQGMIAPHMQPGQAHHPSMNPYGAMVGAPQHSPRGAQNPAQAIGEVSRARLTTPDSGAMFPFPPQNQYPGLPGGPSGSGPPQGRISAGSAAQFSMAASPAPSDSSSGPFQVTPAQQFANMHPTGGAGPAPTDGFPPHFNPAMRAPPTAQHIGAQTPRPPSSQTRAGMPPQPPQQTTPHMQQSPHPPNQMHPPLQPPRTSPHQHGEITTMNGPMPPPRPPSSQPATPSRPPSQAGTPASLPASAILLRPHTVGGHPLPPGQQQHSPPQQQPAMAPRMAPPAHPPTPSNLHAQPPTPTINAHPLHMGQRGPPSVAGSPPENGPQRALQQPASIPALGNGQALQRLISFSGMLAMEDAKQKGKLSYWQEIVKDYFADNALMRLDLWRDSGKDECKMFEVMTPVIPRLFLVTSQSDVKSMTISFDGARESPRYPFQADVHCVSAVWTYRYYSGYTVSLRGQLVARLAMPQAMNGSSVQAANVHNQPKIEFFQFTSRQFDKLISVNAITGPSSFITIPSTQSTPRLRNPTDPQPNGIKTEDDAHLPNEIMETRVQYERATIPQDPVNAFGIPQMTMRCLELAESVALMDDLFDYSNAHGLGPLDSLNQYSREMIAQGFVPTPQISNEPLSHNLGMPDSIVPHAASLTPYPSTPQTGAAIPHGLSGGPTPNLPPPPPPQQGPVAPANAATPQPHPSAPVPPSHPSPAAAAPKAGVKGTPKLVNTPNPNAQSSAAPPTPVTANTPVPTTATKRKATSQVPDNSSPATDAPAPKRNQRKRAKGGG